MIEFDEIPDLHHISDAEAEALCARLRARLLDVVSRTEGIWPPIWGRWN